MVYVLILFTTCCTIASQLILKHGLSGISELARTNKIEFLMHVATSRWVALALALQVTGYIAWFFVITQQKLGVAFALSGSSFYVLMALLSWLLFGERLSAAQWGGIAAITLGVSLLASGY